MSSDVWVFVEHGAGRAIPSSLEALGEARRLADSLHGSVAAILFGGETALGETLARHGADRVHHVVATPPAYDPDAYVATIAGLIATRPPRVFLAAATTTGLDLCARLAVKTGAPIVTGCVNFTLRGERLELIRAVHGGKVQVAVSAPETGMVLATIVPDIIGIGAPGPLRQVEMLSTSCAQPPRREIEVRETVPGDPRTLDVTEAEVIVSAGRGLGAKSHLAVLEELAQRLGGTVAGSRVAVDLGWLPRDRQIGQTGKTVAPKLYIACGISGATQHTVGIKQSHHIVAINIDDGCGLFKVADLALQGDVMAVVPALLRQLRESEGPRG